MAAAIDEHGAMARADQRRNLIPPIPAMSEAAVQQDHRKPGPISRVPDASAVVLHVAPIACDRQRRGAMRFKIG